MHAINFGFNKLSLVNCFHLKSRKLQDLSLPIIKAFSGYALKWFLKISVAQKFILNIYKENINVKKNSEERERDRPISIVIKSYKIWETPTCMKQLSPFGWN